MKEAQKPRILHDADSEKFRKMAVRLAVFRGFITDPDTEYDALPEKFRRVIAPMDYQTLVLPMVHADRTKGATWGKLSLQYGVTIKAVRVMLARRCVNC